MKPFSNVETQGCSAAVAASGKLRGQRQRSSNVRRVCSPQVSLASGMNCTGSSYPIKPDYSSRRYALLSFGVSEGSGDHSKQRCSRDVAEHVVIIIIITRRRSVGQPSRRRRARGVAVLEQQEQPSAAAMSARCHRLDADYRGRPIRSDGLCQRVGKRTGPAQAGRIESGRTIIDCQRHVVRCRQRGMEVCLNSLSSVQPPTRSTMRSMVVREAAPSAPMGERSMSRTNTAWSPAMKVGTPHTSWEAA